MDRVDRIDRVDVHPVHAVHKVHLIYQPFFLAKVPMKSARTETEARVVAL